MFWHVLTINISGWKVCRLRWELVWPAEGMSLSLHQLDLAALTGFGVLVYLVYLLKLQKSINLDAAGAELTSNGFMSFFLLLCHALPQCNHITSVPECHQSSRVSGRDARSQSQRPKQSPRSPCISARNPWNSRWAVSDTTNIHQLLGVGSNMWELGALNRTTFW